nr:DEAD/DEAH box helicase [uncultured Halomonas sp.]
MAFKKSAFIKKAAANPAAHFKTLTKRQYPDVMPHQKEMLEIYAEQYEGNADVALQLPTGSGKTLVGLLIADWRRIKHGDKVVYLCPTRQLVSQTILQAWDQYGIDAVDLSGKKEGFSPSDRTAYKTGSQVAVSTYSGLFNTHTFFEDPNLIIVDDAHAAENYIANMWSLEIAADTPLHKALAEFFRPHLEPQMYSRLTGNWVDSADTNWVEKLPSPQISDQANDIIEIIDAHATRNIPRLYYPWSLLRSHLQACHIYLGPRGILIRPLIPPTSTHKPFANADQRIFMSATLGSGGDLERLTGRKKIQRLPAPVGFQSAGVGRRFFIFPSLSLNENEIDALRLDMQSRAGRSVILTPTQDQADAHGAQIKSKLTDFRVFGKDDIEADKAPFVSSEKAAAILANRYDGIDFPGEECRLLCIDGLPKAVNAQERFIMAKMAATALYNERIQTRVLQAVGRCTRALQDRSAVFVTGTELVDFLVDNRKRKYFHPELQAELIFGVTQSQNLSADSFLENFGMFIENNSDWSAVDDDIRNAISDFEQSPFPAMDELEAVVVHEVTYQEAMWHQDFSGALAAARTVLSNLKHSNLRGYRALWHYLAGSAALQLSIKDGDSQARAAQEQFAHAKKAAPTITWLNTLARAVGGTESKEDNPRSKETLKQVETLQAKFLSMGTATNHEFEKIAAAILKGLEEVNTFEAAQVELGILLGFSAGNNESDAAPDPWWLGEKLGIVFEDHAGGQASSLFGANKARQASNHPKWMRSNIPGTEEMEIIPILVTPCTNAKSGAVPQLDNVHYWLLDEYRAWASHAIGILRELKGTFAGEGDLMWQADAGNRLEAESLTLETILRDRPLAIHVMEVVD